MKRHQARCSALPRIADCPGSLDAEDGLVSPSSAQSLAGVGGHGALESYWNQAGHLDGSQINNPESFCDDLDDMIAGRVSWYAKVIHGLIKERGGAVMILTEYEMESNISHTVVLTGHADLIVKCGNGVTLVIDYKFNWLEVPRAVQNKQLMGYAVLYADEFTNPGIIQTVLTAGGNDEPFSIAEYDEQGLMHAKDQILQIMAAALLVEDPARVPAIDACKYCRAKCTINCQETLDKMDDPENAIAIRSTMLPANMSDVLEMFIRAKELEKLCEAFFINVKKEVLAEPEAWREHFILQATGSSRKILDAQVAFETIVEQNELIDGPTFLSLVELPIGKLEKALKPALKEKGHKVKDQKSYIQNMLGVNLELTQKAPSVKAVKQ